MIRLKSLEERTSEVLTKGHHYVEIALNELVIFVKKNHVLPIAVLGEDMRTTADIADAEYEWIGFVEDAAEYLLYDDDGISKNCNLEENCKKITVRREDLA